MQPAGVGRLVPGSCRIKRCLGQNQAKVPVALMQALLARGTRKRVRNAIADASTASVSSMSDSDAYGIVQDVQMTDTAVSATQSVTQTVPMADSGESDVPAAQNVQNNVPDAQGVRHVKLSLIPL